MSIGFTVNFACNPKQDNREFKFYYYPEKNIYYDVANKSYVYSLDSGRTWKSIADSSGEDPGTMGKRVIISSATDSVWNANEMYSKKYGGSLYNLIGKDTGLALRHTEITEKKKFKKTKTIVVRNNDEKPKKKGLRRFFEKLFGKRNREDK